MNIHQRKNQRRHSVRIGEVEVRLAPHEFTGTVNASFPGRVQERAETAVTHVFRSGFGGHPPLPVAGRAAQIHGGAMLEQ
jgi:hypothetical protein